MPTSARRAARLALLCTAVPAALCAAPPAGAQEPVRTADLSARFAESPRLVAKVPLVVRLSGPGRVRAVATVEVAGRRIVRVVETRRGPLRRGRLTVGLRWGQRRAIDKAARRTGSEPQLRVTVTGRIDGRPGTARATLRRTLRRTPFYDAGLSAPDAPASQTGRFAVAFDLPFLFEQVVGASGSPAVGVFRKEVAAKEGGPRCTLTVGAAAVTAAERPENPRSRTVDRGTEGVWRFARGETDAVVTARAPQQLPGDLPWLVVRFAVERSGDREACAGELRRSVLAVLRRAVRTVVVRAAAPQPGPGAVAARR